MEQSRSLGDRLERPREVVQDIVLRKSQARVAPFLKGHSKWTTLTVQSDSNGVKYSSHYSFCHVAKETKTDVESTITD